MNINKILLYRMKTHKSKDYNLSAVEYYLSDDNAQENVCNIFQCSPRSLMRWVEQYELEGEIQRRNREPIACILQEIQKNKTITMKGLLIKVKMKFSKFDITERHLGRVVRDNNITLKATHLRHEPILRFGKQIDINSSIKKFYEEIHII